MSYSERASKRTHPIFRMGSQGLASIQSCLQQSAAPEMIDDAYCDSCTLDLTINYYISEEQRLSRNQPTDTSSLDQQKDEIRKPTTMAHETATSASILDSVPPEEISTAVASKPGSAKKRRAREARVMLRKLEEVKSQGSVGEIVGEGKAKARELGLQDVKWVKGRGPSSRMTMIARVSRNPACHCHPCLTITLAITASAYSSIAFESVGLHSVRTIGKEDLTNRIPSDTRSGSFHD